MAEAVFESIAAALPSEGERLVKTIKGNVQFIVDGKGYYLALTDLPSFSPGAGRPADLTVTVSETDFLALCSGKTLFGLPLRFWQIADI